MKTPNFLSDLIRRFISKTPQHYQAFQSVLFVLALLTGIPAILTDLQITLPEAIAPLASKIFASASAALIFLMQFAAEKPQIQPDEKD